MTTIEFSAPGSGKDPVTLSSEQLSKLAERGAGLGSRVSFTVYGGEFMALLRVVGLFQADPKTFDVLAAVRCMVCGDGLYMAAVNGVSAAAAHVDTIQVDGLGPFSISYEHVKQILSFFKPGKRKGKDKELFVLEVTVSDTELVIADVSKLFGGDKLTMALPPEAEVLERGEQSQSERAFAAFSTLAGGTSPDHPVALEDGVHFSPAEVARLGDAAALLNMELSLRMLGRRLVAPLGPWCIAYTAGTLRKDDGEQRPFIDEKSLLGWRARLEDLEKGVL